MLYDYMIAIYFEVWLTSIFYWERSSFRYLTLVIQWALIVLEDIMLCSDRKVFTNV